MFEGFDRAGTLRAICGGGRYDKLLGTFGGDDLPCTGFGFGDAVIVELLKDKGLLPAPGHKVSIRGLPSANWRHRNLLLLRRYVSGCLPSYNSHATYEISGSKLPDPVQCPIQVDDVVLAMDEALRPEASGVASRLRKSGRSVELVLESKKMKWAFKVSST